MASEKKTGQEEEERTKKEKRGEVGDRKYALTRPEYPLSDRRRLTNRRTGPEISAFRRRTRFRSKSSKNLSSSPSEIGPGKAAKES